MFLIILSDRIENERLTVLRVRVRVPLCLRQVGYSEPKQSENTLLIVHHLNKNYKLKNFNSNKYDYRNTHVQYLYFI